MEFGHLHAVTDLLLLYETLPICLQLAPAFQPIANGLL